MRASFKNKKARKHAWLGMGGNIGDVISSLNYALNRLRMDPNIILLKVSHFYETPPWGGVAQQNFINLCCKIETTYNPQELLAFCLTIETEKGRIRQDKWGPRSLDIDLLIFEGIDGYKSETLTLPHPHIQQRAFVLMPLNEISPELILDGKTIKQWNELVNDPQIVILPTQFL